MTCLHNTLIYHGYINAFLDNMWQHMNYLVCALTKHLRNSDVNVKILNKTDICTVLLLSGKKYTIINEKITSYMKNKQSFNVHTYLLQRDNDNEASFICKCVVCYCFKKNKLHNKQ